ncbi:MAG: T9SS C-terminal target domain-containing protein, partial [Chitinophagia bacterium]|nr:T9SS C-terminal target domain-containing protein [Chitinophagia bacterium]
GQRGLYRSSDGTTFTNITPSTFPSSYNRLKIGISPSHEEQVYFLGNTPGAGQPDTNYVGTIEWNSLWRYTYVSGDGSGTGGVWSDRSINLPTTGGPFDKFQSQGSYDLVVAVKPDDTSTVFIGGTNLYRSTSAFADDNHTTYIGGYVQGATLPVVNSYTNHHPDQHFIHFLPGSPNKMISTNDGGMFRTDDNMAAAVSWTPLNNGYLTSMFYTCAIDHATTNDVIIGGAQDNGSWYTNTASATTPWVSPRGGDGSYCAIADNGSAYYFSIQQGKIMRAKLNAAGAVDSFARIDPIGGRRYQFINPFIIDPNDNNIMYLAAGSVMWRNSNLAGIPYAGNWDSIRTNWAPFPDSLPLSLSITALAVSKTPANRLYFGTSAKRIYRVDNANSGFPAKRDITSTNVALPFPNGNVSCIAVDPSNADHILLVYSNYNVYSLYYSPDGGTSWQKAGGNLEANALGGGDGPSCRWASIIPVTEGTVYLVGTSVGLFATTELRDTSTVWVQQGANTIGNTVVDMIDYRSTDGLVVVATHSKGIFATHITQVGDVNRVVDIPTTKALTVTAAPNPFYSNTTIQFSLEEPDYITATVTDLSGRIVCTLADGELQSGSHSLPLGRGNLPGGLYFCTVSSRKGSKGTARLLLQ